MLWITVCESRTAPSRLLCLAGMIGRATQAHSIQNTKGSKEKGKRSVIYQIRLYKGISAKCQERILFGSKIDLVCLCMFISVFILYTHKTNTKKKNYKWTVVKQAWERDPSLCRTVSASSHLWAVTPWLWYPIVTAMNFPLLSADYTPVTKLDEWHTWQ